MIRVHPYLPSGLNQAAEREKRGNSAVITKLLLNFSGKVCSNLTEKPWRNIFPKTHQAVILEVNY